MGGAAAIRAGEAFWEATVKDGTAKGLKSAQAKVAALGAAIKVQSGAMGAALSAIISPVTALGSALAGLGIGGVLVKAVQTFLDVSKAAKDVGISIAGIDSSKAEALSTAWKNFKATIIAIGFVIGDALAKPVTRALQVMTDLAVTGFVLAKNWKLTGQLIGDGLAVGFETAKLSIMKVWFDISNIVSDTFTNISNTAQESIVFISTLFSEFVRQFTTSQNTMARVSVGAWTAFENAGKGALELVMEESMRFFAGWGKAALNAFTGGVATIPKVAKGAAAAALAGGQGGGEVAGFDIRGAVAEANRRRLEERSRLANLDFNTRNVREDDQARRLAEQEARVADARNSFQESLNAVRRERERTLGGVRRSLATVGEPSILGGAAGSFATTGGASLMGIGAGGGLKVKDPDVLDAINRQTKVIEKLTPGGVRAK